MPTEKFELWICKEVVKIHRIGEEKGQFLMGLKLDNPKKWSVIDVLVVIEIETVESNF